VLLEFCILVVEHVDLHLQPSDFFMKWFVIFFHLDLDNLHGMDKSFDLHFGLLEAGAQLHNAFL